jgi:hypothetical protein
MILAAMTTGGSDHPSPAAVAVALEAVERDTIADELAGMDELWKEIQG